MSNRHSLLKAFSTINLILTLGVSMSADARLFGIGGTSWKEEVLLHDGSKIVVERSVKRGGRHEIGQQPPIKEQSLHFTLPKADERITWKSEFSEDVGLADFMPLLVDIFQGDAYVVSAPVGCLSYNKWGRPNPPYVIFKYVGKEWKLIPLAELPAEIRTPNLIFSSPDIAVEKTGKSFISAEMIKAITADYRQLEYKSILREALPNVGGHCGEMVYDGKGGWIGMGWFRRQPSYEACLKYCDRENVGTQYCPCNALFKVK